MGVLHIYPTSHADVVEAGSPETGHKSISRDLLFQILSDAGVRAMYDDVVYHVDPR